MSDDDRGLGDIPFTPEVQIYVETLFPCTPPCDSYGVCDNCCEKLIFGAGYNKGHKAAVETMNAHDKSRAKTLLEIENLKMVCRRLAAAGTLEVRDKIVAQCLELFKGDILRQENG